MAAIGIDLGTYNSAAAFARGHDVYVLKAYHGRTKQGSVFPSFVQYDVAGREAIAFGAKARDAMPDNPQRVVWGTKRLLGRSFRETALERRRYRYQCEDDDGQILIRVGSVARTPCDVSADILRWIARDAGDSGTNPELGGEPVTHAVITHPAYFNASQIRETLEAAEMAGLEAVELMTEPAAAALAMGLNLPLDEPQDVLTIDWGAGTLDIVITTMFLNENGLPVPAQADAPYGDTQLGGIDMDDLLLRAIADRHELADFVAVLDGGSIAEAALDRALGEARLGTEASKVRLSGKRTDRLELSHHVGTEVQLARTASAVRADERDEWLFVDEVVEPLLTEAREHIVHSLARIGYQPGDIGALLLVGGPMHMPCVREMVRDIFASNPRVLEQLDRIDSEGFAIDPMESVALGAALAAAKLFGSPGEREKLKDYMQKPLPFDCGLMISAAPGMMGQGEILLQRPAIPPVEGQLGPVGNMGEPGESVALTCYQCRDDRGEEVYERLETYCFYPAYDVDGHCLFQVTLRADANQILHLHAQDVRTGAALKLELHSTGGETMPRPMPINVHVPDPDDAPRAPVQVSAAIADIAADVVQTARRRALAYAQLTDQKCGASMPAQVRDAYDYLMTAVARLPASSARHQDYAAVQHGCERLKNALINAKLATGQELALLESI